MSVEENKANVRRHVDEIWHKGNLDIIPELIAPNYVFPTTEQEYKGPEGFKQFVTNYRTAFPDIHFTIDDMVAEGDWVAVRYTSTGTFTGQIGNIAPTGKKLKMISAIFYRFEGGKQVEVWGYQDYLTFYQQLGLNPPGG
jgi:steroid delta-isomerase-like uncharacterized protein